MCSKDPHNELQTISQNGSSEKGVSASKDMEGAQPSDRFTAAMNRLASFEEKAPDDFVERVMAALPEKPRPRLRNRFSYFWPDKRYWPIPAMAGALMVLAFITAIRFAGLSPTAVSVPVVFDLYAPSAQKVSLSGAFSGWSREYPLKGPDPFGYWSVTMHLAPGHYEYGFRIDGATFMPDDDGQPIRPDGFGLKNSVVVVPKGLTYPQSPDLLQGFYVISDASNQFLEPSPAPEITDSKWQTIVEAGLSAGVRESVLLKAVLQLKKARFTPEQARMVLFPLFRDLAMGQHSRYLLDKLAEGALKGAPAEMIADVCMKRYHALKKAAVLLKRAGFQMEAENLTPLQEITAQAIESGQDVSLLAELLQTGRKLPPAYTAAVILAGESLRYAELDNPSIAQILKEALQRRLTPEDMNRLIHYVKDQMRAGLDGTAIIKALWI